MWWLLQIIAALGCTVQLIIIRQLGLTVNTYLIYMLITACITSWGFAVSFNIAPSFIQPWFVGNGALALFGFIGSYIWFGDPVHAKHVLGALLTIIGGIILIL